MFEQKFCLCASTLSISNGSSSSFFDSFCARSEESKIFVLLGNRTSMDFICAAHISTYSYFLDLLDLFELFGFSFVCRILMASFMGVLWMKIVFFVEADDDNKKA